MEGEHQGGIGRKVLKVAEDCDSCDHRTDDSCTRPERCAYCGNGLCYCDSMVDTEDGPMHRDCAKPEKSTDELAWALDLIESLREELLEAKDINQRLVEGNATEWDT
jgi:hypothetical protein